MLESQNPQEQRLPSPQDTNISQLLRQQVEYYFSLVNLVTDDHMLAIIQQSSKGYVSLSRLLQFPRIRQIFTQCIEFELTWRETKQVLGASVAASDKLLLVDGKVRSRRPFKQKRDLRRVIYLEGQGLTKPLFFSLLQSLQVPASATFVRQGRNWLMAQFPNFTQPQLVHLIERLTSTAPAEMRLKILNFEAFRKQQKRFNLFLRPHSDFRSRYKMPRQRILQYDEIPMVRRWKKVEKKKKIVRKRVNYNQIFRSFIITKNPMTIQRYEARRAKKIQEWRQRKQERKQVEKAMNVQQ